MTEDPTNALVTIGVPVFNGAAYLDETFNSIRQQTHHNLEIIYADNASTDESLAIAERHARDDPRVRILGSEDNRGAAWNYNRIVGEANGEFFKWQAHDDLLEPTCIASCMQGFFDRPDVVLTYAESRIIDAHGEPVRDLHENLELDKTGALRRSSLLLWRVRWCHAIFGVFRTSALRQTKLIQPFDASDITLLLEASLLGRLVEVPDRAFLRRNHAQKSRSANKTSREITGWFDPTAVAGSRSWTLLKSYQRAARDLSKSRLSRYSLAPGLAIAGTASELYWHARKFKRSR